MLAMLFGMFAFFWTAVFAVAGIGLLAMFLIPLLIIALVFRIGIIMVKLTAGVVLLCLLCVCLF